MTVGELKRRLAGHKDHHEIKVEVESNGTGYITVVKEVEVETIEVEDFDLHAASKQAVEVRP